MTPQERQAANRLIAEKIEGAKPYKFSGGICAIVLPNPPNGTDHLSYYSTTKSGAWGMLHEDLYTDLDSLFRALNATGLDWNLQRDTAPDGSKFIHAVLFDVDETEYKIESLSAPTLEEAIFTALHEYAKTL